MPKSFIVKLLALSLLSIPGGSIFSREHPGVNCEGVRVEIQVKPSDPGSNNGTAEATVSGAETPIYYIFYKASGELLSKDVNSNKVKDIAPGTYYCSIVDGKGCTRKSEFKIE
jgi:hypothetical protein